MDTTSSIDTRLIQLAATQDGVVSARQLAEVGVRSGGRAGRRDRGMIHQLLPRLYSVGVPPDALPRRGWEMAAQLRPRSGPVVLGHASAAARLGIWTREDEDAPVHVMSEGASHTIHPPTARFELITHRSRHLPIEDAWRDGTSRVSTAARTIADMGTTHTDLQLTSMIRAAIHVGELNPHELSTRLDRSRGAPGTAVVASAIEWYELGSAGTRSRTEDEFVRLVALAGLPVPLVNVRNATGIPGVEADFVWTSPRLVVEIDGRHHDMPGARHHDSDRDEALRRSHWVVLRVPYQDVWRRPWDVIAEVHRALGHCSVAARDGKVHKRP